MAFWTFSVLLMTSATTYTWTHSLSATPGSYVYRLANVSTGRTTNACQIVASGTNTVQIYPNVCDSMSVLVEAQVIPTSSIVAS